VQATVQSNSLYYNILYVDAQMHSKKRVKHYSGEKCILEGIKYAIFYIKVYKKRCVSVQVLVTNRKIGSYGTHIRNSVNIIHL
jgi:hypothetical protein